MNIPETVAGRPVSNRGVHLLPAAYHATWMRRASYWIDLLVSMGMSWVVIITDGDSVFEQCETDIYGRISPYELLLQNGIIPIVRDGTDDLPFSLTSMEWVRKAAGICEPYGLRPFWIVANEPFDDREWNKRWLKKHRGNPPDANNPDEFKWVMGKLQERMSRVIENGGIAGFPDGPCYPENPFPWLDKSQWDNGLVFYAGHHYGKGRPIDYPYDATTRLGDPRKEHWRELLEAEWRRDLDDYADDPQWWEESLELINEKRLLLANEWLTTLEDDTCFLGYEKVLHWAQEAWGMDVPMALTEGGWCPRDRAGTGPNTDIRWPHTTPKMVGKKTLAMYEGGHPFFSICPWLLADDAMVPGGFVGWPYDSWVGWAYSDKYGAENPVVELLQANPSGAGPPEPEPELPKMTPEQWAQISGRLGRIEELVGQLEALR